MPYVMKYDPWNDCTVTEHLARIFLFHGFMFLKMGKEK